MNIIATCSCRPWNKGKLVGQKTPLRLRDIWAIRVRLQLAERTRELKILILRYIQTLIIQMSQTSVCNRYHSILQQLCRCLLSSLDRLPGNQLMMTQKLISDMLGVRREGITEAAGILRKLGVIEYSRGHITVLDRHKLEHLSCECYAIVN